MGDGLDRDLIVTSTVVEIFVVACYVRDACITTVGIYIFIRGPVIYRIGQVCGGNSDFSGLQLFSKAFRGQGKEDEQD